MFLEHFKVARLAVPALGMMHYWDDAHLAPGADITCLVHLSRGWHFGSHLPNTNQAPSVMKGIRGNGTHAQHRPQRHLTGACAVCKLSFMNEKWGGRKCSRKALQCISTLKLLVHWVSGSEYFSCTYEIYTLNRILFPFFVCVCLFKFTI